MLETGIAGAAAYSKPANRPHHVAGVADAICRGPDHLYSGRWGVILVVDIVTPCRLDVGFSAAIHPRHDFLEKRHHLHTSGSFMPTRTPWGDRSVFTRATVGSAPATASSSSATQLGFDVSARHRAKPQRNAVAESAIW